MKKISAKEYVEANLLKMKEEAAKLERSAERTKRFDFRLVFGVLIGGMVCGGLFGLFESLASTED